MAITGGEGAGGVRTNGDELYVVVHHRDSSALALPNCMAGGAITAPRPSPQSFLVNLLELEKKGHQTQNPNQANRMARA
jgi:hypothetical protein